MEPSEKKILEYELENLIDSIEDIPTSTGMRVNEANKKTFLTVKNAKRRAKELKEFVSGLEESVNVQMLKSAYLFYDNLVAAIEGLKPFTLIRYRAKNKSFSMEQYKTLGEAQEGMKKDMIANCKHIPDLEQLLDDKTQFCDPSMHFGFSYNTGWLSWRYCKDHAHMSWAIIEDESATRAQNSFAVRREGDKDNEEDTTDNQR